MAAPPPEVALPLADAGWYAAVAQSDAPLTRLLDVDETAWGALVQGQALAAVAAFGAGEDVVERRIGLARAALELAEHFEHLGHAIRRTTAANLAGRVDATGPDLAAWQRYLGGGAAPERFVVGRALGDGVSAEVAAAARERCGTSPDSGQAAVRRHLLDCAAGGLGAQALAAAEKIIWAEPDWTLAVPSGADGGAAMALPVFDPALAWGLGRAYAALAAEAACGDRGPEEAYLCGLAQRRLGDTAAAEAAMKRFLAGEVNADALLVMGGAPDSLADLQAIARGDDSVLACARAARGAACSPPPVQTALTDLSRQARKLMYWIDEKADRAPVLLQLEVDDGFVVGHAGDLAAAYLRAGDPVSAGAVLRFAALPLPVVDGEFTPSVPGTWRHFGLQVDAATQTGDAQLAWRIASTFAAHHGAWIGAREAIQLWGLALNREEGSTATE